MPESTQRFKRRAAEAGVNAKALESCRVFVWLFGLAACIVCGYWGMWLIGYNAWAGAVLGAAAWVVWTPGCDK